MNNIFEEIETTVSEVSNRLNQNESLNQEDIINLLSITLIREEIGIQE